MHCSFHRVFTWTFSENMGRIFREDSQRSLFNTESLCLLPASLTQLLSIHSLDPLLCLSVSCKPFLCVFLSVNFNSFSFQALTNSWAPIHVNVCVIWLRSPQWANDQLFLLSFWENPSLQSFSQRKHCPYPFQPCIRTFSGCIQEAGLSSFLLSPVCERTPSINNWQLGE